MIKGMAIGLVVGLLVGWLLFYEAAPSDGDGRGLEQEAAAPEGAAPPSPSAGLAESASAATLVGSARAKGGETSPTATRTGDVDELARALRRTRSRADWAAYRRTLAALGAADTPEADARLVQVLGDAEVAFPVSLAQAFMVWLQGSEVEGIAEAARTRVALEVEAFGYPVDGIVPRWAGLIGAHGTLDDVAWVREKGGSAAYRVAVAAFLRSGRPEGLAMARTVLLDAEDPARFRGDLFRPALGAMLEHDFPAGVAVLEDDHDRMYREGHAILPPSGALSLYVAHLPAERLGEGKRWLLETFASSLRYPQGADVVRSVLNAIGQLERRGLDASGFDAVYAWAPDTVLEIAGRGGPEAQGDHRWSSAMQILRLDWRRLGRLERVIAAMEAALPHLRDRAREEAERQLAQMRTRATWSEESLGARK
jgi:hypothetical protein